MPVRRHRTIIIEGIIGVGKTTFCRELAARFGLPQTLCLTEPVTSRDEKDNPYLDDYYADPARWAFEMQTFLLKERARMQMQAQWHVMNGQGNACMDRSYFGDVAFAYLQKDLGYMSERDFNTYMGLFETISSFLKYPNVCIRLDVSPTVAFERIKKRQGENPERDCETAIELEYLVRLDQETQRVCAFLEKMGTHVITLPWNEDRSETEDRSEIVNQMAAWVDEAPLYTEFPDFYHRVT